MLGLAPCAIHRGMYAGQRIRLSGSRKSIEINVNPTGNIHNCINCVIALDATLGGRPASALPLRKGPGIWVLEAFYHDFFRDVTGKAAIDKHMKSACRGSRGIVYGGLLDIGHVWNVINVGAEVRYLDGQDGTPVTLLDWRRYNSFKLLRTN